MRPCSRYWTKESMHWKPRTPFSVSVLLNTFKIKYGVTNGFVKLLVRLPTKRDREKLCESRQMFQSRDVINNNVVTKLEKEIQRVNDDLQQLVDKIETHANDKERYKNLIEKNRLREQLDQYQTRIIDLGDDINRRERENKKKVSEFLNKHNRGNRTNHRVLCTPNLQYYIAINTTALRSQFDFEMIDNEKINGMNAKTQLLLSSVQELHKIVA
eukprot:5648_1